MFWFLLAFLTGMAVSIQSGVNSQLRQALNNPVLAATISFGSGFIALLCFQGLVQGGLPTLATIRNVDWWKWTGGLLGAIYVTTVIITIPRIGAASLVSLSVAGQLVAAILLDHYGLLGFAQHPANVWRMLGGMLIIAGVLLVVRN